MNGEWTVQRTIEVCERGRDTAIYLSGGVAGLGLIGTGDLANSFFADSPGVFMPVFITLLIFTAGLLARSLRAYLRLILELERSVGAGEYERSDPAPEFPLRRNGEKFRQYALILLVGNAAWLVLAVWWAGISRMGGLQR